MGTIYINPWRRSKDGKPVYQKTPPKLKSAFADRRKRIVHSRSELRSNVVISHVANCWITRGCVLHERNGFDVYDGCAFPLAIGATSWAQANCLFANLLHKELFGDVFSQEGSASVAAWH